MKSDKMPHIIYTSLESLIKKIEGCENNPEHSSKKKKKISEYIPCVYSRLTIWGFHQIEDKHTW